MPPLTGNHTRHGKGKVKVMKAFERKIEKYNVRIDKFSGIDEMVNYIESKPADAGWDDTVNDRVLDRSFHGARTYADARDAIKKGVNIKDIVAAINTGNREYSKKRNVRHVTGGAPCVPAAVASDPRAMYQRRNQQITGAYNVYVTCNYPAYVRTSQIKEAGIKILKEVLRVSAIKPVNLWCGTLAIDDSRRNIYGTAMQVMDAGKAFNAARVSYALTEAGFNRVFGFACRERTDGFWDASNSWGMGRPLIKWDAALNEKVLGVAYKNMVTINIMDVIEGREGALKGLEAIR